MSQERFIGSRFINGVTKEFSSVSQGVFRQAKDFINRLDASFPAFGLSIDNEQKAKSLVSQYFMGLHAIENSRYPTGQRYEDECFYKSLFELVEKQRENIDVAMACKDARRICAITVERLVRYSFGEESEGSCVFKSFIPFARKFILLGKRFTEESMNKRMDDKWICALAMGVYKIKTNKSMRSMSVEERLKLQEEYRKFGIRLQQFVDNPPFEKTASL